MTATPSSAIANAGVAREYNIGPVEQIPPGEGREFLAAGVRIAVFHLRSGAVRATQADCPHKNGPLADGLIGGETVVCPFHAWKFDLPSGLPLLGECALTVYPARLSDQNEVLVSVPAPS